MTHTHILIYPLIRKNELVDVIHPVEVKVETEVDIHVDEDHAQVVVAEVEAAVETAVEAIVGLEFIQKNRKNLEDTPPTKKKKVWNKKD